MNFPVPAAKSRIWAPWPPVLMYTTGKGGVEMDNRLTDLLTDS